MPASWDAIGAALRTWIKAGGSLDDAHVIFDDQGGTRPTNPYVVVRVGALTALSPVDGTIVDYDGTRPAGSELHITHRGPREFNVELEAFADGPVAGDSSASALLNKIRNSLQLSSVRDPLNAAGVAPFDLGPVQNLAQLLGPVFRGRASLNVRFSTMDDSLETTTYIETYVAIGTFDS